MYADQIFCAYSVTLGSANRSQVVDVVSQIYITSYYETEYSILLEYIFTLYLFTIMIAVL